MNIFIFSDEESTMVNLQYFSFAGRGLLDPTIIISMTNGALTLYYKSKNDRDFDYNKLIERLKQK